MWTFRQVRRLPAAPVLIAGAPLPVAAPGLTRTAAAHPSATAHARPAAGPGTIGAFAGAIRRNPNR